MTLAVCYAVRDLGPRPTSDSRMRRHRQGASRAPASTDTRPPCHATVPSRAVSANACRARPERRDALDMRRPRARRGSATASLDDRWSCVKSSGAASHDGEENDIERSSHARLACVRRLRVAEEAAARRQPGWNRSTPCHSRRARRVGRAVGSVIAAPHPACRACRAAASSSARRCTEPAATSCALEAASVALESQNWAAGRGRRWARNARGVGAHPERCALVVRVLRALRAACWPHRASGALVVLRRAGSCW
jgi:hypothetical protein